MASVLAQISRFRRSPGFLDIRLIEEVGGEIIEPMNYVPDPATHRQDYYYNSRMNQLFKRKWVVRDNKGMRAAVWEPANF
jgi:hypothetical protein